MSERVVFSDFCLAQTSERRVDYQIAMAFGYSTRMNYRRLESHTHAFWDLILHDLAQAISKQVKVIPQLTITSSASINKLSPETSLRSTSPANKKECTPDFTGVFMSARIRQQAMDVFRRLSFPDVTIPSSLAHVYQDGANRQGKIPRGYDAIAVDDPSMTMFDLSQPSSQGFEALDLEMVNWPALKIVAVITLFHVELKRMVTRRSDTLEGFTSELNSGFLLANTSAKKQARLIFQSEPETKWIITIAGVGEWWQFMISTRDPKERVQMFTDVSWLDVLYSKSPAQNEAEAQVPHNNAPRPSDSDNPDEKKAPKKSKKRNQIMKLPVSAPEVEVVVEPGFFADDEDVGNPEDLPSGYATEEEEGDRQFARLKLVESEEPLEQLLFSEGDSNSPAEAGPSRLLSDPSTLLAPPPPTDSTASTLRAVSSRIGNALATARSRASRSRSRARGSRKSSKTREQGSAEGDYVMVGNDVHRWAQLIDSAEEPFVLRLRTALPESNTWSNSMLIGSPASNQRLYIITRLLREEAARLAVVYPPLVPNPGATNL
ncbi:hypothetical protein CC1G_10765 [Coprinopsis cinerea okayama7|uniref:Uncharacterized protein n=1 Tax=Coprinopsis cinerea (strain Okayama-7 / 130 / ATCC MYA-4618 / FGSC 9003) TaxID=240176 RepID=A8P3C8_COPC7|nr:hypothetical protein CC1G_10765 [Coprinopsis cinerea okayama7\|eukprot:XP_001838523.2 hypothetical protein CC1G_10765 [Coprinopsis cinerea okayama7\